MPFKKGNTSICVTVGYFSHTKPDVFKSGDTGVAQKVFQSSHTHKEKHSGINSKWLYFSYIKKNLA